VAKILIWDGEMTNLSADFGTVVCVGFKEVGTKKVHVPSILDFNDICDCCGKVTKPQDDKPLLKHVSKILNDADAWVVHYGQRFDVPFVNSRLLFHGLPPLRPVPLIDTWRIARNHLKLHNNRLATIQEFLGTQDEKNAIKGPQWQAAAGGDVKGIKYIIEHCRLDILVLDQAYEKIKILMPNHPNFNLVDRGDLPGCPRCGSHKIRKDGTRVAASRIYQTYRCNECGGCFKDSKAIAKTRSMAL
jgi:uncharacterized protein YprB with RNaseH-like and TPR domain